MSLVVKLRKGEGRGWAFLKRAVRGALRFHIPVGTVTRPLFRLLYRLHVGARESGIWPLRFFWYEPLFRSQCTFVGGGLQMEKLPYLTGTGRILLGENVRLSGKPSIGFSNRLAASPEFI